MNFLYSIFGVPLGYILWACYAVVKNYGVALIIFTLLTKLLLLPLSIKQQKSTVKMALFQPKIAELQKKYGNNKQKYQEELMALYEKEHYSPTAGCLPMLIQLPILFGLIDVIYRPLTHILHLSGDVITSLTTIAQGTGQAISSYSPQISILNIFHTNPQAFASVGAEITDKLSSVSLNFLGINLGSQPTWAFNVLILIPILSGLTALLSSIIMMRANAPMTEGQAGSGMTKGMMFIMPIFSVIIAFQVPAGVGLYWILSNILQTIQSLILNKIYNPREMIAAAKAKEEEEKERKRLERLEARKRAAEEAAKYQNENAKKNKNKNAKPLKVEEFLSDEELTQKEINRRKLAEARRRDAEKYGEEYVEVTDEDLK
ncbi:YidC/Oxa1 family membrane protein insertase [Zongyangia hominis]|uniref:YidC/Oxa1 family membrane protein insertase n=1 Tax=Zongyangia hominis TaxID=2763677 RepID=A0A926IC15_9FIRM|nr:YidC/Oxa1 family membrane protein insertase [Zongyangia hominis]MBC8570645.1 YidC/Oxa1 family membrane protein insertase [Zongyangia hominis]